MDTRRRTDVLLLTACIRVGDCIHVARRDADTRQRDYRATLERYLADTDCPVVWVENSGADTGFLDDLRSRFAERLEVLSFAGNGGAARFGKGHGERETIRYALDHSRYRDTARLWIKITGRYYVRNLAAIVGSASRHEGLQAVIQADRLEVVNGPTGPRAVPSMLVLFTARFFDDFFWHHRVDDSVPNSSFEHALAAAADELVARESSAALGRFYGAAFEGISGTCNADVRAFYRDPSPGSVARVEVAPRADPVPVGPPAPAPSPQESGSASDRPNAAPPAPTPARAPADDGARRRRHGNPDALDAAWYLGRYPDLIAGGLHTPEAAGKHWCTRGRTEGRFPSAEAESRARNPGPAPADWLDARWYLDRYPDLRAGGRFSTPEAAEQHWFAHGCREGRFPNAIAERRATEGGADA